METGQIRQIIEQSRIYCINRLKQFPPEEIHKCELQSTNSNVITITSNSGCNNSYLK